LNSRQNNLNILHHQSALNSVAQLTQPPTTFIDCVKLSTKSVRNALNDGSKLLEVEFPPLPLEYLEDSSSSARAIADANLRWAIEFAKSFVDLGQVSIILPDQPELDDALKYVDKEVSEYPIKNLTLATIRADSIKNAGSLDQIFLSIFGATVGGTVVAIPDTKLYICLTTSTQELPDIEKLHLLDPNVPIVLFNLKLDVLVKFYFIFF
jgi:hypothetical protein